jgi:hypothetical protein
MLGCLEYQRSNTKHLSYVQDTLLDGHQILNIQFQPNLNIRFSSTLMMILFTYLLSIKIKPNLKIKEFNKYLAIFSLNHSFNIHVM